MKPSLEDIIRSPHWICLGLDRARMAVHFVQIEDDIIDKATFLDQRLLDVTASVAYRVDDIHAAMQPVAARHSRRDETRLILHTAFCCSTLLARCMQVPGRVRVIRELPVFSGLPRLRHELRPTGDGAAWNRALEVVDRLTSRAFGTCAVVNKPSNVFLSVAADYLRASQAGKALLIYMGLPEFLISCAKKTAAGTAPWLEMHAALDPAGTYARGFDIDVGKLPALRIAAVIWHAQMHFLANAPRPVQGQVRRIDAASFLASPLETVQEAHAWFGWQGIAHPGESQATITQAMSRDAKRVDVSFDPERRGHEQRIVTAHFRDAIEETLRWSESLFGEWSLAEPGSIGLLLGHSPPAGN